MAREILLVEDQTLVRNGLVALINTTGSYVATAAVETVNEAITLLSAPHTFALVVCDFSLRGETALDLLQKCLPLVIPPVILLTSYFNATELQRCVTAGARGFLYKECDLDELKRAFEAVLLGSVYFAETQEWSAPMPMSAPTAYCLTPAEFEILKWLATGMSNKQIAIALGKSSETVKIQVSQLLRKLACKTRTQAVMLASEYNLI